MPRLNKVLKELNVGLHTVAEVLQKEGKPLTEVTPNADITDEQYALLVDAFSTDKKLYDTVVNKQNKKQDSEMKDEEYIKAITKIYTELVTEGKYSNEKRGRRGIWVQLVRLGGILSHEPFYKKGNLRLSIEELDAFDMVDSGELETPDYWIKPKQRGLGSVRSASAQPASSTKEYIISLTDNPEYDKRNALAMLKKVAENPEGWSNKKVNQLASVFIISHNTEKKKALQSYLAQGGKEEDFHFDDDPRWPELQRLKEIIKEKKQQLKESLPSTEEKLDSTVEAKSQQAECMNSVNASLKIQKDTKEKLRVLFEQLLANSEKGEVNVRDLWRSAKEEGVVPNETNISQFNKRYVDASGLFDHCRQEGERLCWHFAPNVDLYKFIYFGSNERGTFYPKCLEELRKMAMSEKWDFEENEGKMEILDYYFYTTLYRLQKEGKITYSADKRYAAFNTGLLDSHYEPIYCMLGANPNAGKQPWVFKGFCTRGEGRANGLYVNHINKDPQAADYLHQNTEFLYDCDKKVRLNYDHIIVDHVERLPLRTLFSTLKKYEVKWPDDCMESLREAIRRNDNKYLDRLRDAIKKNDSVRTEIGNILDNAVKLARDKIRLDYRVAIPSYYARANSMGFFIPLAIEKMEVVDTALVVQQTKQGHYIGKTIYPLKLAYMRLRLICRPEKDWLSLQQVVRHEEGSIN